MVLNKLGQKGIAHSISVFGGNLAEGEGTLVTAIRFKKDGLESAEIVRMRSIEKLYTSYPELAKRIDSALRELAEVEMLEYLKEVEGENVQPEIA